VFDFPCAARGEALVVSEAETAMAEVASTTGAIENLAKAFV
jgi:hypothetical protein